MEKREIEHKPLRREIPEILLTSQERGLCDPVFLLTPEEYRERQEALGRIATNTRLTPPDDVIIA